MCGVKKNIIRVFAVLLLLTSLGFATWFNTSYLDRITVSINTSSGAYTNFSVPLILNSSNWGNNACQEASCNDTSVTWVNGSTEQAISYFFENYSATGNTVLVARLPYFNISNNQIYVYYNSTSVVRSPYYSCRASYDICDEFEYSGTPDLWSGANFNANGSALISTSSVGGWNYLYSTVTSIHKPYIAETFLISTGTGAGGGTAGVLWGYNGTTSGSLLGIGDLGMERILYTDGAHANGSGTATTSLPQIDRVLVNATASYLYRNDTFVSTDNHGSNDGASAGLAYYYQGVVAGWEWFRAREIVPSETILMNVGAKEGQTAPSLNNTVSLNYPANNSFNTTNKNIMFGYTPTFYNGNLQNCSLYTNETTWSIKNTSSNSSSFCYQETANASTACGGLATGKYSFQYGPWDNQNNLHDGDWNTGAVGTNTTVYSYFYINYTKPTGALPSSKWQVKTSGTFENVSVGSDCWNFGGPLLHLMIYSTFDNYYHITCENFYRGHWQELLSNPGPTIYEEAMWWNITTYTNNSLHTFNRNFSKVGNYTWGIACWNETNQVFSTNRTLTIVPPISNTTTNMNSSGYGFRADTLTNMTFTNPSSIPILCNYTINGILVGSMVNATGSNISAYNFNLSDGYNNFTSTCWDTENYTTIETSSQYAYVKHFILVVEDTGANFTTADFANKTIRAISENSSAIFQFNNDTANVSSIYYLWTTPDYIRIEKTYVAYPNDLLFMELNLGLIDTEAKVCVANTQQFYETIFYSNSKQPVVLVNNLAKCYVLASYTRHIYADALMAKAYTIKALYYLYTFTGNSKMYLSSMDGSTALAVNIDVLQFITRLHTYKLTTDEVSVGKYDNHTYAIYYFNQKQDNTQIDIEILNGSTSIFSYSDTTSPNNFTIYFDFSAYDLSHSVLKLIYTKHTPTGTETREILLTEMAGTGLLPASVAFMIAGVLMFFSLTLTASKHTFGYFGIFSTVLAAIITTLTIATPEIRLMQAALVIILIFQIMVMRQEYAGVM